MIKNKWLFTIICIVGCSMPLLFLSGCSANEVDSQTSADAPSSQATIDFEAESVAVPSAPELEETEGEGMKYKINPANIYSMDEEISNDGYTYNNFTISMSKDLPAGVPKDQVKYFSQLGEQTDEDGTLISPHTYAFVTMDITNHTGQQQDFSLNSSTFLQLDDDLCYQYEFGEARYRSGGDHQREDTEYFHQIINPEETITTTIGYILDDEKANADNLYFSPASALYGGPSAPTGLVEDNHRKLYKIYE